MKRNTFTIIGGILITILLGAVIYFGFTKPNNTKTEPTDLSSNYDELIFETKVSPNEDYAKSKEDVVFYELKIYQNEENTISVFANSNSEFFDELYYQIKYDKPINKENVSVEWTTIMGNPQPTEDDQIVIADVKISSSDNEIFSERKINFAKRGFEIIIDTLNP